MLEEGDQDDPVIDPIGHVTVRGEEQSMRGCSPEVGSQVDFENVEEPEFSDRVAQGGGPN